MINPRFIGALDWAASVVHDFSEDCLPVLLDETAWVPWAQAVAQAPSLRAYEVPDPNFYDSFLVWAYDLFRVVES